MAQAPFLFWLFNDTASTEGSVHRRMRGGGRGSGHLCTDTYEEQKHVDLVVHLMFCAIQTNCHRLKIRVMLQRGLLQNNNYVS
jgi:hypothetical protein